MDYIPAASGAQFVMYVAKPNIVIGNTNDIKVYKFII